MTWCMETKYILKGKEVVPTQDIIEWANNFENSDRRVANTLIGKVRVSTVFLGLNHNWREGPPLIFETMVFGGRYDGHIQRYSTWDQAEIGHAEIVKMANQPILKIIFDTFSECASRFIHGFVRGFRKWAK